jgi:hypothetical protein
MWLFHYTSLASAAAIALTGQLFLSPLSVLNDPQEATAGPISTMTGGTGGVPPKSVATHERIGFELLLESLRDTVRVACLTRDADAGNPGTAARMDARGYARPRIWTQYGDKHAGVCLVLDRAAMEVAVKHQFGSRVRSEPVTYVAGFDTALHAAETVDFDNPDPKRHFQDHVLASLFNKNADWEGEREHRIVVWGHSDPVCAVPIVSAVVGLVLGLSFPAHQIPVARRVSETFDVVRNTALLSLNNRVLDPSPPIGPDGEWHRWTAQDLREKGRVFDDR